MTVADSVEMERVSAILRDPSMAQPAADFPAGQAHADAAGLYSWWVDGEGRAIFVSQFGVPFPELIYAGQAGATSSRAGVERSATLRSRITVNQIRGNIESSTFRQTLTAVLLDPLGLKLERPGKLAAESNARVSE